MRHHKQLSAAQVARALEFQSITAPATYREWLVHFEGRSPIARRYQEAVSRSRVLRDHRAAIDAEPVDDFKGKPL